jgi:ATP adenylyltransferase
MSCYCSICAELNAEPAGRLSAALGDQSIQNAVLMDSSEFVLIPSVGPLRLGHSLLVTKSHISNLLGSMTSDSYQQVQAVFAEFKTKVVDQIDSRLQILGFEHGAMNSFPDKELCSTVHAHVHLVPMFDNAVSRVINSVGGDPLDSLKPVALSPIIGDFPEYLLVFRTSGNKEIDYLTIRDASQLPSQFMRRLVGDELGIKNWNWKISSGASLLKATIDLGFRINTRCVGSDAQLDERYLTAIAS